MEMSERGRALSRRRLLEAGVALPVGGLFSLSAGRAAAQPVPGARLEVEVSALQAPQAALNAVAQALARAPARRAPGAGRNLRVLSVREIDPEERGKSATDRAASAGRWRAVAYDYANQVAIVSEGRLGETTPESEIISTTQPLPSPAEWAEARELLLRHSDIGPRLRAGELIAYRPMPPVVTGVGDRRRLVTVGVLPRLPGADGTHEIVGVDIAGGPVQRFAARAPARTAAGFGAVCGAPTAAYQSTSGQGLAGSYAVTVRRGSTTYWTFTVARPSASSGLLGSGVELRNVAYRGRKVLHRAHVPILNVKYDGDACGPYRDWQYDESFLRANGSNVAPGIRLASSEPRTIIQSGSDTGNFQGAAVWTNGEEITLMAELEAGWYRYISEWTLHTNGTIKPRFGFAAVQNSCVCQVHHHHAYWRLNFDIGGAASNYVQRRSGTSWVTVPRELAAFRDAGFATRWRVRKGGAAAAYEIRPNATDGRAKACADWPFPKGDLWFLRYRAGEIDDGYGSVTGSAEAGLDRFVQGQSINGADVVVWYGAHFTHEQASEEAGGHDHVVGPDLVPVNW